MVFDIKLPKGCSLTKQLAVTRAMKKNHCLQKDAEVLSKQRSRITEDSILPFGHHNGLITHTMPICLAIIIVRKNLESAQCFV